MDLILSGYIQSAQLKQTADNKLVCNMVLSFTQRSEQGTVTREIELTAWNSTAETAAKTYANGGYVIVEGTYRDDVVDRTDGSKDHHYSIVVSRLCPGQEDLALNQVCFAGTAGLDSEYMLFESGAIKASNRIAVRRNSEITDWITVEGWGKTAETMRDYVNKGKQVYIKGQFKIESWTDKATGSPRFRPIVTLDRLTLLGGGSKGRNQEEPAPVGAASAPNYDKIPF